MLCKMLAATGIAGAPGSHFHVPSLDAWLMDYGLKDGNYPSEITAIRAVFAAAKQRGQANTDVFGLRLQYDSLPFFLSMLKRLHPDKETDRERFETEFGRTFFVYLKREDHLDQAISKLRAEQTGLWHLNADGSDLERENPTRDSGYDREILTAYVHEAATQNAGWSDWFNAQGVEPLALSYHELSAAPQVALNRVLGGLGFDPKLVGRTEVQTRKLSDLVKRKWLERFRTGAE